MEGQAASKMFLRGPVTSTSEEGLTATSPLLSISLPSPSFYMGTLDAGLRHGVGDPVANKEKHQYPPPGVQRPQVMPGWSPRQTGPLQLQSTWRHESGSRARTLKVGQDLNWCL
eukprot:FR737589.1.p2 GENE.FR737589.1~~FR737589.1.p2  ORF type:complete len:114 (-),score=7.34 FR737589.1:639-980(-)